MTGVVLDEFQLRFRRAFMVMAVGATLAVVAIIFVLREKYQRLDVILVGIATVGVAAMYGALWYADRTECPGCQTRIGLRANPYRISSVRSHKCGACGIVFDQLSP